MIKRTKLGILITTMILSVAMFTGCKDNDDDNNGGNNPSPAEDYKVQGIAQDAITYENLTNGMVRLTYTDGEPVEEQQVNMDGSYSFNDVEDGIYNVMIEVDGYKEMKAKNIQFGAKATALPVFAAMLPVKTSVQQPVSAISGMVVDSDQNPIEGAAISVSADSSELTNGYFTSSNSNSNGFFSIGAIPLESNITGELIPNFKVRCVKDGYETMVQTDIELIENELMIINFVLSTQSSSGNTIFEETFESSGDWMMTGFWHRQMNADITNSAYPDYVELAPNDNSNAKIPNAYQGQYAAWYGEAETGNFMGEPDPDQDTLSGGRSMEENMGTMTSPVIDLTSVDEASLSFWSWYEIESVNPNDQGYDIMEVFVVDMSQPDDSSSVGRLNPFSDPILDDRQSLPFTSGGFNKAPVWALQEFDLTDFAGKEIRLKFNFRTVDALYNGFRGLFVDKVRISDQGIVTKGSAIKQYPADPKPRK